jgi:sorbitol-specific phosphotransferase system component IIBC
MNNIIEKKEIIRCPIKKESVLFKTLGLLLTGIKEFFTKPSLTQILSFIPFVSITVVTIITKDTTPTLLQNNNPAWANNLLTNITIFCSIPLYFWLLGAYTIRHQEDIENLDIDNMDVVDIYKARDNGIIKIIKRDEFI